MKESMTSSERDVDQDAAGAVVRNRLRQVLLQAHGQLVVELDLDGGEQDGADAPSHTVTHQGPPSWCSLVSRVWWP
jgi:hypothetical protein